MRLRVDGKVHEIDAAAQALEEREAHGGRGGRPPQGARRREAAPRRVVRDGAAPRRRPRARGGDGLRPASTCSRRASPARSAATRCPSSSRACSRSTTRWARARAATAWARSRFFDPKRVVAYPRLSLAAGAIKGWDRRNQFYFQMLQASRSTSASTSRRRSRSCPQTVQDVVLHGSGAEKIPFSYLDERGNSTCASTRSRA